MEIVKKKVFRGERTCRLQKKKKNTRIVLLPEWSITNSDADAPVL